MSSTKINGCPHLSAFRSNNASSKPFRALSDCLRVKPPGGRASVRRDPHELPRCAACSSVSSRLYACLACAAIHCHVPSNQRSHAAAHAAAMPPGHEIAVDVDRAELFCCACVDQVYDRDFDAAVVLAQSATSSSSSASEIHAPENLRKKRRIDYRPWSPDLREQVIVGKNSSLLHGRSPSDLPWGLRGLNNLGNTCFMNSVLQALLHAPPLRNYFLSDRHNRYFCQKKRSGGGGNANPKSTGKSGVCLACDMDTVFSAVFSGGDRKPYSPAKFLYSWWQYAANLASYQQQDAHEFFISVLDGIHEKGAKEGKESGSQGASLDISLDLEPGSAKKVSTKSSNHSSNGVADSGQNSGTSTLVGCLDRFTRPERLGTEQKFFCQQCQVRQESLKQMSIRKLPLVSCFHIKRFEHSSTRKMSRKVDRYLQFPFSLDMTPYLSSSILRNRFGNRIFPLDGDEPEVPNELCSEFELFAVVTHTGKLDAGHYVTYLRLSNNWYKCDDAWVTQVNEDIVRAAQGYMMFYVQKMLFYKASEKQASA